MKFEKPFYEEVCKKLIDFCEQCEYSNDWFDGEEGGTKYFELDVNGYEVFGQVSICLDLEEYDAPDGHFRYYYYKGPKNIMMVDDVEVYYDEDKVDGFDEDILYNLIKTAA